MIRILFSLLAILIVVNCLAQEMFKKGTIRFLDGDRIDVQSLLIQNELAQFKLTNPFAIEKTRKRTDVIQDNTNSSLFETHLENIYYIKVVVGTHVGKGAAYGTAFMGASALIAVIQVASDDNRELKGNAGLIIGGFVAGGAIVGALIGAAFERSRTIYNPLSHFSKPNAGLNINRNGIALVLSF